MIPEIGSEKPALGKVKLDDILGGKVPAAQPTQSQVVPTVVATPVAPVNPPFFQAPQQIMTPSTVVESVDEVSKVSAALNAVAPAPGTIETVKAPPVDPSIFGVAPQQAQPQAQPQYAPQPAFMPQQAQPQYAPQPAFMPQQAQPQYAPQSQQMATYSQPQLPAQTVSAPPQGGFMWGTFGVEVQRFPINRFKASVGPTYRLSVIDRNIAVVKTHWLDDFGYFYCFTGKCCEHIGIPSVRYIVPIVLYSTDMVGQITSPNFDIMYLSLADDEYKALKALDANIPIDTLDFIVTCSDQKFQELHMQNVGPATWRQYPQLGDQVMQKWMGNPQAGIPSLRNFLPTVIARVLNETSFNKLVSGASQDVSQSIPQAGTSLKSFLK